VGGFFCRLRRRAGWKEYSEYLHHGLFAIRRRLGLQRFAEFTALLDPRCWNSNAPAAPSALQLACAAAERLLRPDVPLSAGEKAEKIVYRGTFEEVAGWLDR
jgi:tRNA 2-selenouridine synthase